MDKKIYSDELIKRVKNIKTGKNTIVYENTDKLFEDLDKYPSEAVIFKIFEIVFNKSNRRNNVIHLNTVHDYLNNFFKKYTIYKHGVDYSSKAKLLELLIVAGYKIKDNHWLKLQANYFTFDELRNYLGNDINPLLIKTKYNDYDVLDLVAWHRSRNDELGNYQFHSQVTFPYVLYTDDAVDCALSNILKFRINKFSVIHYKIDGKEIILDSIYVKESMRKRGYGYELLSNFFKFVCKTYKKEIRIHAMTDEMRSLLSKCVLALSSSYGQHNWGKLYNSCSSIEMEVK